MAFNPDEYLAKSAPKSGFDPDAYLAKVSSPSARKDSPALIGSGSEALQAAASPLAFAISKLTGTNSAGGSKAALEHYGNAALLGHLPQAQALSEKLMPDPSGGVDAKLRAQGFNVPGADSYITARDATSRRLEAQGKEFPGASALGTGLGIVGGGAVTGGVGKALGVGMQAAPTVLGRIGQGVKAGAAMGALANPGDTEGDIDLIKEASGRLKGAAVGGAIGGAMSGAAEVLGPLALKARDYLKGKAEEKAFKALGRPVPTMAKKLSDSGRDKEIGRTLLDEGAIPILGTSKRINSKVEVLKDKVGEEYGALLDQADAQKMQFTPIKINRPKKLVQVQDEVRMTPVRFDENPAKRAFPWLKDSDAPPIMVRGEEQPIQKALFVKPEPSITAGKMREVPRVTVDTAEVAKSILKSPELAAARTTPGMESTVAAIEKQVETLAKNGQLTLREAQALRQRIDKSINFTKGAPELRGAQEGLYQQRSAIADALNEGVNKLVPGAGKDALKQAGRRYNNLATASDIGERQIARDTTNRAVSLTDTIAGAGGLSAGGPGLALAAGALNKAGRAVGNSVMARSADAASKLFGSTPSLVAFARNNPLLASAVAGRIAQPGGGMEQQTFPELQDPQVLGLFKANPQLIDSVQDPKLKAAILKRVGSGGTPNRAPAQPKVNAVTGPTGK